MARPASPSREVRGSGSAGSLGYGVFLKGFWFTRSLAPSQQQPSMAYKELFSVVIAAHVWGHHWCWKHWLFCSDNDAVVHVWNARTSKVLCLMQLPRILMLEVAHHSFAFSAQHLQGVTNQIAMLSLVFVGRNSGGWLQVVSLVQLWSFPTCWQTWLPWFRTAIRAIYILSNAHHGSTSPFAPISTNPLKINNIAALTRAWHKKSSRTPDTTTPKCTLS